MDRTYVFNSDGNAGGGSRIDINSLLPGMMSKGIDPGLLALMNNNGFGGENGIWGVIYLAIIWYPIFYWLLNWIVSMIAFPKAMFFY